MHVLGLMSGTSADGVDAVLAKFTGNPNKPNWKLINQSYLPYPKDLRKVIIDAGQGLRFSPKEFLELSENITEIYAKVALDCDVLGQSEILGCHGQTLWHRPPSNFKRGASSQIIAAPLLAHLTGKKVAYEFRAADLLLGGQGAPLLPIIDEALIGRTTFWRAILNLGGISNITLIPPKNGPDKHRNVIGWDCGPANSLIDLYMQKYSNLSFDKDGFLASKGKCNERLIGEWLEEPFFHLPPPKSTGRDQFGVEDLEIRLKDIALGAKKDIVATLTGFSAAVVAQDLNKLKSTNFIYPVELLVSGGGCRNQSMFNQLVKRCIGVSVKNIEDYGIPPLAREALGFALLAWWKYLGYPANTPHITGAKKKAILGICVEPPGFIEQF